jgi:hypothetical protein
MTKFFAAIGIVGTVVLIVGCGLAALILGNIALDVNRAPVVLENGLATIEAADSRVVIVTATSEAGESVAQETAVPIDFAATTAAFMAKLEAQPTQTPYPTYTPVKLIDSRGLPSMGPYTLDQVQQCEAIKANNSLDTLPSPQRELCGQYVGGE